jgi:hypothetical protein
MIKFKEKPGDDTGMQTRVWGPAGWLFLHSIAQNYPWRPTNEQKNNYLSFFKLIGKVLPCRYCRESYEEYITSDSLELNMSRMESRETLVTWLYNVHNRINEKLEIKGIPTLKEVWNKYESFRSKCTKSVIKPKKGCLDPLKGFRKKCNLEIINIDKDGNSFGKKQKMKIKLLSIKKSNTKGKKLMAIFKINDLNKKTIHFGAAGMSDFTKHKDINRRNRYIKRHLKDLNTNDPTRAGYLSMFILWNKKSLKDSINDYKRRINIYNKTNKFPKNII